MSELGPVSDNAAVKRPLDRATFFGTAYHKVSGRNQVAIPKQFKRSIDDAQEGPLLLMRLNNEPFMRLYTKRQFDKKMDEIKENPEWNAEKKSLIVDLMARSAEPVEPDSQGRFVLPGRWMDALNVREEVAFCGAFTFIKIWPAELQREVEKAEAEKMAAVAGDVSQILNM
jgi:MraZ protein